MITVADWVDIMTRGWGCASVGDFEEAYNWYSLADNRAQEWPDPWGTIYSAPNLSLLRHRKGILAKEMVHSSPIEEDRMLGVEFASPYKESADSKGMAGPSFNSDMLYSNILQYTLDQGLHVVQIALEGEEEGLLGPALQREPQLA